MFQAIANHLWQSTVFALAVGVLCLLLRKDGAHIRYWLWWIASVKFLVPFSLLSAIGARFADSGVSFVAPVELTIVATPFSAEQSDFTPGSIMLAIWAGGALFCLGRWIAGASTLRRLVAEAKPDSWQQVDDRRQVRIYRTRERIEPGIVGIFRPVLLLPEDIEARLQPAQLDAVIAHEIGHVRRADNLTASLQMLVEALFWFFPVVWWIGARLIDERERACDELVVSRGHDAEAYAEGILDVCEYFVASPIKCAAGISGSDLKRRITQIMRYQEMKSLKMIKKILLSIAAIVALAAPMFAGLAVQQTAVAQDTADTDAAANSVNVSLDEVGPDYMPIVKIAPVYPPRAAARGLEGYAVVQYDVDTTGSTQNVTVIESSLMLFERPAVEAVQKFKYQPWVVDGQARVVEGVTSKIEFLLEDDDDE
jgi:bla regulator protein BlaR1